MKHIALGSLAALIAAAITVAAYNSGVYGLLGLFAATFGYPALLLVVRDDDPNMLLFTAVNWLFYFCLVEGIVALKRRFSN